MKNGTAPGIDFTQDFEINAAVPLLSDITVETPQIMIDEEGYYLAGQQLTFTLAKTVMDKYGADIEWSVTGSGITGTDFDRNADTNKLILDIPTDFRGGTITITAKNKNGTETKSLPIEVQAFT